MANRPTVSAPSPDIAALFAYFDLCGQLGTYRYLDHAATTFMPTAAMKTLADFQHEIGVAPGRGRSLLSQVADRTWRNSSAVTHRRYY